MTLTNLNIAILGAGRSGLAVARFAMRHGAHVCIYETADHVANIPADIPVQFGVTPQIGNTVQADLVVISPGVETEGEFARSFVRPGVELIGELELACRFYQGTIIAITGTNGKTTTTALIETILRESGKSAIACGNYGIPVTEVLLQDTPSDILVVEVSSFQLETIRNFHPHIAVWLNFAPDHMDRYKTVQDYYAAKLRIFENQTEQDSAIVRLHESLPTLKAKVQSFSPSDPAATLYYAAPYIMQSDTCLINLSNTAMEQSHNAENVMAATLACRDLGVTTEQIAKVLRSFTPPGHRCELVRNMNGVQWFNDSKATNLHALQAAIQSQHAPVVLIAGGKDKGLDYTPLLPLLQNKVRACIVFGQITEQLYNTFSPVVPTFRAQNVEDCVNQAAALAQTGDAVLFSPGTSSFDMFSGYVERGMAFRQAVNKLSPLS